MDNYQEYNYTRLKRLLNLICLIKKYLLDNKLLSENLKVE